MNKKTIYLSVFLVLGLFFISACSQTVGKKITQNVDENRQVTYQGVLNMLNKCTPISDILNNAYGGVSGNQICNNIGKTCLMTYIQPVPALDIKSINYAIQDMKPVECSFINPGDLIINKDYAGINILSICCSPN